MGKPIFSEDFKRDAVHQFSVQGYAVREVADNLGVGMLKLNKWVTAHRDTDVVSKEDISFAQENERSVA